MILSVTPLIDQSGLKNKTCYFSVAYYYYMRLTNLFKLMIACQLKTLRVESCGFTLKFNCLAAT